MAPVQITTAIRLKTCLTQGNWTKQQRPRIFGRSPIDAGNDQKDRGGMTRLEGIIRCAHLGRQRSVLLHPKRYDQNWRYLFSKQISPFF